VCGRVYSNAELFDPTNKGVPAAARYEVRSRSFMTALAQYDREASEATGSKTVKMRAWSEDSDYLTSVHPQDPSVGRVGVVLEAIGAAAHHASDYERVDVAVAYASAEGVRLLDERLSGPNWSGARKRFLVSMDFGFTQPRALVRLSELSNAEVRVPNGRAVLASATLRPPSTFHAKVFLFGLDELPYLSALVVGSANLTASALTTGAEVVTAQSWAQRRFSAAAWSHLKKAQPVLGWFEETWKDADLLEDVLDEYRVRRRALPKPARIREDKTQATRRYLASLESHEINGDLPVQLAIAKGLWVDASSVINNRKNQPGTQLNTPKGTRVFFGIDAEKVPLKTTFEPVDIRIAGYDYMERTIRFNTNGMDVINLPIPWQNGVDTYKGAFLLFTRDSPDAAGRRRFTLTVTNVSDIHDRIRSATNSIELSMKGGRRYGLLF
jgi:HKD family nuclease